MVEFDRSAAIGSIREARQAGMYPGYRRNHDEQRTRAKTGICILQS